MSYLENSAHNYADSLEMVIQEQKSMKAISTIGIIASLIKTIDPLIFRLDANGNLILNKKGRPKINWSVVLTNLVKIIGALIAIRNNLPPRALR
jgi:hypothetical protein